MSIVFHDPTGGIRDYPLVAVPPTEMAGELRGHFYYRPAATYYGLCQAKGCGNPWSLNLDSGTLNQCGCPDFTPGGCFSPEGKQILARLDLTPKPRPTRWFRFDCPIVPVCGVSAGWWLDGYSAAGVPCRSCGWHPLMRGPYEFRER